MRIAILYVLVVGFCALSVAAALRIGKGPQLTETPRALGQQLVIDGVDLASVTHILLLPECTSCSFERFAKPTQKLNPKILVVCVDEPCRAAWAPFARVIEDEAVQFPAKGIIEKPALLRVRKGTVTEETLDIKTIDRWVASQ